MNKLSLFSVVSSLFLTTSSLFPAVTKADSYAKYGDAGILRVSCYKQSSDATAYPDFLIDTRNYGSTMIVAIQAFYYYDGSSIPNRPYLDFSTGTNYYLSDHSITAEGINTFSAPISAQGYLPTGGLVTLEEADPQALSTVCDNRPTPIDDPGGGGGGGGCDPTYLNNYCAGASSLVSPSSVVSRGSIGLNDSDTPKVKPFDVKEPEVQLGEWQGKSWQPEDQG